MLLAPKLYYVLWIIPMIIQGAIAYMMVHRKLREELPFFFHYTVFQVLSSIGLFVVFQLRNKPAYFYAYWTCIAVGAMLGFAVIYEIFDNAFRPFAALRDFSRVIFRWACMVLLVAAIVMVITSTAGNTYRITLGIMAVERGVLLIQGGLLLFLLMYSSRLGMTWKHHSFGVALGFGFNASAHLILNSLRAQLGVSWHPMYNMLLIVCYNVAVVTWAVYIFSPEPARITEQAQFAPKPILQRWNHVLSGEESEELGGTFIPSMERIVDRVMASKK
ncbi:MAG TPA: hypothetical protein VK738_05925 [Terriglobales bacterium]|jgi:hypothetical protein|nr:hypothetical protein [Terriglobales bacterium]